MPKRHGRVLRAGASRAEECEQESYCVPFILVLSKLLSGASQPSTGLDASKQVAQSDAADDPQWGFE